MTGRDPTAGREQRRPDGRLIVAVGAAVAVRVALALAPPAGGEDLRLPDSVSYDTAARSLADRGELWFGVIQRAKREPGYPLFMAGCYTVFGRHVTAVRVVQAVLCGLLCLPVYGLASRLGGRRSGLVAAWIAALYPNLAVSSVLILTEGLFTLGLWWALWLLGPRRGGWGAAVAPAASALCWGGLAALRSETLVLFVVVAVVALIASRNRRAVVPTVAAGLAGIILASGLWAARNRRVVGHPVITTLNVGETLYDGFWSGADGGSDKRFMRDILATDAWQAMSRAGDEVGQNRWLKEQALAWARCHPGRAVRLAWGKVWRTWRPMPSGRSGIGLVGRVVMAVAFLAVALSGVIGCVRARGRWRTWIVWFVPVALVTATHLVIVGSIRYRIPVMPFLVIMAGAAVRSRRMPGD